MCDYNFVTKILLLKICENIDKMNFSQKTYLQMLLFRIFWYALEQYWQIFRPKKFISVFRFRPIVKSMISLFKLNTRAAGPISFHKFWNFGTAPLATAIQYQRYGLACEGNPSFESCVEKKSWGKEMFKTQRSEWSRAWPQFGWGWSVNLCYIFLGILSISSSCIL